MTKEGEIKIGDPEDRIAKASYKDHNKIVNSAMKSEPVDIHGIIVNRVMKSTQVSTDGVPSLKEEKLNDVEVRGDWKKRLKFGNRKKERQ